MQRLWLFFQEQTMRITWLHIREVHMKIKYYKCEECEYTAIPEMDLTIFEGIFEVGCLPDIVILNYVETSPQNAHKYWTFESHFLLC